MSSERARNLDLAESRVLWQRLHRAARAGTGARLAPEEVAYLSWLQGVLINADLDPPVDDGPEQTTEDVPA